MAARMCQGRSTFSDPSVTAMPPLLGRITPRSILVNVHCLPLRWSSTVRLPPLEADLGEIAAVEAAGIEALDPGQHDGEVGNAVAGDRGRVRGRRGRSVLGAGGAAAPSAAARSSFARRRGSRQRRSSIGRRGDEGTLVAAGEDRDLAVGLDPHRHFRADQAQAFGANAAGQQARAGDADFRLRRARHHGAFGVPHHDVANAQRRASVRVPLDLRAADLDVMARAEIFLDRRGEPRRRDIELDRTAGEPPPEGDHRDQDETAERTADDDEFAQARSPQPQSHQTRERACQAAMAGRILLWLRMCRRAQIRR